MKLYIELLNKIRDLLEKALAAIPEDIEEAENYMARLSIYDNMLLVGILAEADAKIALLNLTRIYYKGSLSFDEIMQERKLEVPIKKLLERLGTLHSCVTDENRTKYEEELMQSIAYMREAQQKDITESTKESDIDDIVFTIKTHTDIRIKLQTQLIPLLSGYMANMKVYLDNKDNDYGCFYEIVVNGFHAYMRNKDEVEKIEDDTLNSLYEVFDKHEPIVNSFAEQPTAEDWGEMLKRRFDRNRTSKLLSVFEKTHNIKAPFDLPQDDLLNSIYWNCKDKNELNTFYEEMVRLNYIKQNIMNQNGIRPLKLVTTELQDNHVVASGGSNNVTIKSDKDGKQVDSKPKTAIEALDAEVRSRISLYSDPKSILLPVRAAREAHVNLPFTNLVGFNQRYDTNINSSAWSRWIRGTGNYHYDEIDLNSYKAMFERIMGDL